MRKCPVALLAALVFVCSPCFSQEKLELPESEAWASAIEAGTRTKTGRPGEKYWTDRTTYRISAELDPTAARVDGKAVMTYENRSPEPLRTLAVHLRKNLHAEGAVRNMSVAVTGGVKLERVALNGAALREGRGAGCYSVNGTVMTVFLRGEDGAPGKTSTVEVDWSHVVPPSGGAPRTGHEDHHTFFLGYWYPQFAVRDDVDGWVAEPYLGMGEFYMGYADYEVEFTAPHGFIVRATGELTNPEDVYADVVIERLAKAAAGGDVVNVVESDDREPGKSTLEAESGKLTWKFAARDVRDFAVSVSDLYVWDATSASVAEGKRAMIHAVYTPDAMTWAKAAEYARHTIEFMSRHVAPYAYPHATVCEGVCGGGMEFPMMTDIGVTRSARGVQGVIAHELIHMWFPMVVGSNEKHYSWMDEGTTTYLTSLASADYYRSERPPHLGDYRTYVRFGSRFGNTPPMQHADGNMSESGAHGFATYQKTAVVLHQLRYMMGEETFDAALREYFRRWAYKHPNPRDFFNVFSEAAGRDLDWYFRTWMYESWRLDFAVDYAEREGSGVITITRKGKAVGDVVVRVTREDGEPEILKVPAEEWFASTTRELEVPAGVTRVELDPDRVTLDLRRENDVWSR